MMNEPYSNYSDQTFSVAPLCDVYLSLTWEKNIWENQ